MLKINRERRKNEKNWRFGHKKIVGPRPLGGRAPGAPPPPLDPLYVITYIGGGEVSVAYTRTHTTEGKTPTFWLLIYSGVLYVVCRMQRTAMQ